MARTKKIEAENLSTVAEVEEITIEAVAEVEASEIAEKLEAGGPEEVATNEVDAKLVSDAAEWRRLTILGKHMEADEFYNPLCEFAQWLYLRQAGKDVEAKAYYDDRVKPLGL